MWSSIRCRIVGLLSENGQENGCQSFCTIRYWSTKFPNVSKGATKLNFRVGYTMACCCLTLKKGLVHQKNWFPLMAVIQHNKHKVYPVIDYRELNEHVNRFTAKLRKWCKKSANVSQLDLRGRCISSDLH